MPRKAVVIVALSLAFAAVTGTIALTKTVHLGQAAARPSVSTSTIAKRKAQLDRFEASLRAELAKKPPAVPKVPPAPAVAPARAAAPAPASSLASVQRVIYRRPAPIIVHKHRAGGGESEHEGSEHGDGGEGGDD
jgi:hypothetical protein